MSQSRQLAAIMFTDVVGYTAMMGENEQFALQTVNRFREVIEGRVLEYNGKIIQYYGDGCLLLFNSSVDAVQLAQQIQKDFCIPPQTPVRIGIHMGDILIKEGNLYGDVVNIAARIQSLATPGGIYISEIVYTNILNKKEIKTEYVKTETLKNVKHPARIFKIVTDNNLDVQSMTQAPKSINLGIPEKSIAVLAFVNMSNDPEQEYFSDGMAEEILISLSHLKDLKVAGRTSSFQFKGKNIDLREIGEKLCVSTVLEGSVRKQNNRLRVSSQLINVKDGFHLWSEKYDRNIDDIFAIQDDIAFAITENLKIIFYSEEKAIINKIPTENNAAYELYLKGRYFYNKRGSNLQKALECFQQAIELDPHFALAYTGIADTRALLSFFAIIPANIGMSKARTALDKAIELDPFRVETYATLGFVNAFYNWNLEEAKKNFQDALAINPNYSQTYNWYCLYLFFAENNMAAALEAVIKNVDLDPLSPTPHNLKAGVISVLGREAEALSEIEISLELDPNYFFTYLWQGLIFIKFKNFDKALHPLKKSVDLSGNHQWPLSILCWLYANTENLEKAQSIHEELLHRKKSEYISGWFLFITAYSLKNYDIAFEFLNMAFDEKMPLLMSCRSDLWPIAESLKKDEIFLKFIKELKFPD